MDDNENIKQYIVVDLQKTVIHPDIVMGTACVCVHYDELLIKLNTHYTCTNNHRMALFFFFNVTLTKRISNFKHANNLNKYTYILCKPNHLNLINRYVML